MKFKRFFAALLAAWLAYLSSPAAYAHEIPDKSKHGSITMKMEYNGKPVTGGVLTAYYVGSVQENDGDYSFVKTPDMASFPEDYASLDSPGLAADMAAFVKKNALPGCAQAKNQVGKAVFSDLELGLYLIVQSEASVGFAPISPFLVSVPMNENGHYVYDVTTEGKFQLYQKPKPTEPTQPTDPKLPQTGQLNWPVPVLAVLGLLLFSAGWTLRFHRKRDSSEE